MLAMVPVAELVGRFVDGAAKLLADEGGMGCRCDAADLRGKDVRADLQSLRCREVLGSNGDRTPRVHEQQRARRARRRDSVVCLPTSSSRASPRAVCTFGVAETTALFPVREHPHASGRNAKLYVDLQERETRVAELDKFKSDLIAMLAHDFRGPLTTIIGYAELVGEGALSGEGACPLSRGTIGSNAWRLANFATDTLTMSQLERNEIVLDLAEIDLGELAREAATAHASVAVSAPSHPLMIECDPQRLRQVLDNLIGNAVKYSGGDQVVRVVVAEIEDGARISIADRGIGIPASELEMVFARFARASNARRAGIRGTGFGLYLSRMIVQLHGGTISVSSVEGKGSTFTISLPRHAPHVKVNPEDPPL